MDKSDYFQELIKNCIDMKKARTLFEFAKITCVEKDSNIKILCVLTDKEDGAKIIYSISDNEEIFGKNIELVEIIKILEKNLKKE